MAAVPADPPAYGERVLDAPLRELLGVDIDPAHLPHLFAAVGDWITVVDDPEDYYIVGEGLRALPDDERHIGCGFFDNVELMERLDALMREDPEISCLGMALCPVNGIAEAMYELGEPVITQWREDVDRAAAFREGVAKEQYERNLVRDTKSLMASTISFVAEQSVLGAALLSEVALHMVLLDGLKPGHFSRRNHARIYAAALGLHGAGREVNVESVVEHLEDIGLLEEVGGRSVVYGLVASVPNTFNWRHYARIVRDQPANREHAFGASKVLRPTRARERRPTPRRTRTSRRFRARSPSGGDPPGSSGGDGPSASGRWSS